MLTENYCDKDLSLALKEAGYIGQGRCYYDLDKEPNKLKHFGIQVLTTRSAEALNFILAVHLYDAQKWLREEKGIIVGIINNFTIQAFDWYVSTWEEDICRGNKYVSYEEALAEGIKEAVKILKNGLDSKR